MKKRILCLILAVLMLVGSLPLSVLANESGGATGTNSGSKEDDSLPVVSVSSLHYYDDGRPNEFRALPDMEGNFYFDIALNKAPKTDENILVYYRTVDDTAVAKWGDYESVGTSEELYVTLNKDNGYKARVVVKSQIIDHGFVTPDRNGKVNENKIITRRFLFELTRVEGTAAELHKPKNNERDQSEFYCYLRANQYSYQSTTANPNTDAWGSATEKALEEYFVEFKKEVYERFEDMINDDPMFAMQIDAQLDLHIQEYRALWNELTKNVKYDSFYQTTDSASEINTPKIQYKGTYSDTLNFKFDEEWKDYITSGLCNLGISINGKIVRDFWDSDGDATFNLYYNHGGEKKLALTLYLEGEFDDSEHFGWEHAFEYAINGIEDQKRDDHMEDNFIGFVLYDNDGNVAFEVKMGDERSNSDIRDVCYKLNDAIISGHVIEMLSGKHEMITYDTDCTSYYAKLPSNFALADSYSYEFISDSTDIDEIRWLENVNVSFSLISKDNPAYAKDEKGNQMVTTNIDTIKEGDPIKMAIRFDRPVYIADPNDLCYVLVDVYNDKGALIKSNVRLNLKQFDGLWAGNYFYYACDTLVFEGAMPAELNGVKIDSLRNIRLDDGKDAESNATKGIKSFFTNFEILGKSIADVYVERDLRTPVATINVKSLENWAKSKSVDISVMVKGSESNRFKGYVTVYYQWSNSDELPTTYNSKVTFNTNVNGEVIKTIVGTGNGEMYLHLKAVSDYGNVSISDSVAPGGVYDGTTYTPYGPFKFDNSAPELSANDISVSDNLKERTISLVLPNDNGGVGLRDMSLYYIPKNSETREGVLLKKFSLEDFNGDPKTLEYTISHKTVGVGVDSEENVILERGEIEFYWILTDKLGNTSGKTAEFVLVFDTNNYLENEITSVGAYDISNASGDANFKNATNSIDGLTFIYNYRLNKDKNFTSYKETAKKVYYGFSFTVDHSKFGATDGGTYGANIYYKGNEISDFTIEEVTNGVYTVWFHTEINSGRYDIQLTRTEGDSVRVSKTYSVYATDGEEDATAVKNKVEFGTLLSNSVYQLSSEYPYFYYKDSEGNRKQEYYNNTKQPATFSSESKAKDYVYYKELSDIYLVRLTSATASALISGTTGYLIANGETVTPQADQYWIRYKSKSWTPTSGDSSWVYYYYGTDAELYEDSLSPNLQEAINDVANRIVGYGKNVILTDTSLFLGTSMGNQMLDKYGMPYLLDAQIHSVDEISSKTMCDNVWGVQVAFAGDKNIYKSTISVGVQGTAEYKEYPIVGNFVIPEGSRFQYMTYEAYNKNSTWEPLDLKKGETFIDVLISSGVYYIRELSDDGVSVYGIYVDKESPKVTFYNTDDKGNFKNIPVDGIEILDIRTKDLYIGGIAAVEYDRLSYVAVYKVSNLSLVAVYTAGELSDNHPIPLEDGNYYIVVSDRSGNYYTVTAKVSSTDLECEIKESTDKFIKVTCNRKSDQIVRYEVYLNGELVTSTYATEQTFDKAGFYSIYIQDIYGNIFTEERSFSRKYPEVTWKYLGSDGKYHVYNSEDLNNNGFIITEVSGNQYKISTSVKTRFSFSENYEFEFVGAAPEYSKTIGTETAVTIEQGQSFTLKVYYKNHKDSYTIYSGVVDVTPPSINVSAEVDVLRNGEYDLFDKWASGNVGDVITMDEIYYVLTDTVQSTVANGGTVSSDIIKIKASDANELSLIEIYVNGALVKTQNVKSGFSEIVLNEWGSYRIVAKDTLGNVSEFAFTNGMPDGLDYFVDGVKKELELHGYLNFETVGGKHVYTKVDYGKTDFELDVKKNADVFISLGVSGKNAEIYGFKVADGCIYPLTYTITRGKDGANTVSLTVGEVILDMKATDFKLKNEYLISKKDSYAIYASINADKVVSFKVYASDDSSKVVSVNARVELEESNTIFVSSEISKRSSNVSFKELGVQEKQDIRANNGFTVDESMFDGERIASIRLYYSKLNDLDVNKLEGKTNLYVANKQYKDEGFYILIVRNHYGNEKVYKIAISRSFGITSSVTFGDGNKIYYTKDYSSKLYSNNQITLDIIDEGVTVIATLNGLAYTGFVQKKQDNVTYFIFSEEGTYEVKATDSYGNVIIKHFEINKSSYTVSDELLTGYNDKALKRDEGYTNQKLSIDKAVYDRDGIYYLAIQYGKTINVLFDAFAQTPVTTADEALIDVIGANGDGVYTVICRNRYGAVVTKNIHYRSTPTLKLERTTRSKSEAEIYDLNYAISLGFWSNNTLIFTTEATTYVFTVNGNVTECPRTLVFENAGDYGSFEYDITYIDEYGFEYSFKAYLVRKNVTINVPSDIGGVEIDGVLNTKNDISITFDENTYATYTRNKGEEVVYHSGDVLKKDGTYRFTIIDYAGNASTLTIKKDTIVEFELTDSITGNTVQNGSVVNTSKVSFKVSNKDSAYIEMVMKDGVVQNDFTNTTFTEDGKWELILSDKLGNKAYFCFYIITRSQNGFAYTTPYEYQVTEIWYDSGDGVKISYMNFVIHSDHNSSFEFSENGKYYVVMTSNVTGNTSTFEFTVNTNAPEVSLVGCNVGETTIKDVTITGYKVGDCITVYRITDKGEQIVEKVEVTSSVTKAPTITEGGKYRIVVESESGVATELTFARKHVMNTAGSVFIMIIIGCSVVGLFTGLVYRNKSKTDD